MKILLLSASVGSGHVRAAQAVERALRELAPEAQVRHIDVLDLSNPAFRTLYGGGYLGLACNAPHLLGYLYELMDRPSASSNPLGDRLRLLVERANLRALVRLLRDEPADVVVSTHFLPAGVMASLRRRGRTKTPQAVVVTDFEAHKIWFAQPCERYFAATADAAAYLRRLGAPQESLRVTGIPIHPNFARPQSRVAARKALGLQEEKSVLLLLGGGNGIGPMEAAYRAALALQHPVQIVAVAGRNEALKGRLEALPAPDRHRPIILGYTDRMHDWMAAATLVVTKPGGLTVSEALACGAPVAVLDPIPGQESRNSDFLLEKGAGIKINNPALLSHRLDELLADRSRLVEMRGNALLASRPRAAYDVAREVLALASRRRLLPAA